MTRRTGLIFILLAAGWLSACTLGGSTPPSSFYVLTAGPASLLNGELPVTVSLGPVTLPDAVLRPQIATRPEPARMVYAEFHRWAGDLRANVEQVLLRGLSERLGKNVIHLAEGGDIHADYRLAIQFLRFDGKPGRQAVLEGQWRLKTGDPLCLAEVRNFTIGIPLGGNDYTALVEGLGKGLDQLSDGIASVLVKQPSCRNKPG